MSIRIIFLCWVVLAVDCFLNNDRPGKKKIPGKGKRVQLGAKRSDGDNIGQVRDSLKENTNFKDPKKIPNPDEKGKKVSYFLFVVISEDITSTL